MTSFSTGVVTRLVHSHPAPFHERCLPFVPVCSVEAELLQLNTLHHLSNPPSASLRPPAGSYCAPTRARLLARKYWKTFKIITSPLRFLNAAKSRPSHFNRRLNQTAYSVKSTSVSMEHPVRVSTACCLSGSHSEKPCGWKTWSLSSCQIPKVERGHARGWGKLPGGDARCELASGKTQSHYCFYLDVKE